MKATVRQFHSPDADLDSYVSTDPADDALFIQMLVGPADGDGDGDGEESFDLIVCTPRWLAREASAHGPIVGRHHLVVDSLDIPIALEFLRTRVADATAPTWHELALQLGRIGKWEFEDYRETPS